MFAYLGTYVLHLRCEYRSMIQCLWMYCIKMSLVTTHVVPIKMPGHLLHYESTESQHQYVEAVC